MKTLLALALVGLLLGAAAFLRQATDPEPEAAAITAGPDLLDSADNPVAVEASVTAAPVAADIPSLRGRLLELEAETDAGRRSKGLAEISEAILERELSATLDALATNSGPASDELRQLLVRRWAKADAPAAAAWVARLPEGAVSREALAQLTIAWANTDLAAAADWVAGLPASADKESATLNLAYEASRLDPVKALDLARSLPETFERDNLLAHAFAQWAGTDAAAATAWAESLPDGGLRQRLLGAAAVALAKQDGAGAATLAANALGPGAEQERVAVAIVERWGQTAPQAAADWVARFPEGPAREAAQNGLQNLHLMAGD